MKRLSERLQDAALEVQMLEEGRRYENSLMLEATALLGEAARSLESLGVIAASREAADIPRIQSIVLFRIQEYLKKVKQ